MLSTAECFCGYATPSFSLHDPVMEERCAQINSSLTTESPQPYFLQVYQTPVQGKRRTTEHKYVSTDSHNCFGNRQRILYSPVRKFVPPFTFSTYRNHGDQIDDEVQFY